MIKLGDLLDGIAILKAVGNTDLEISTVCSDSRMASGGSLFVAVKGTRTDGHDYIDQVTGKGVAAVVCERLPEYLPYGITFILVENSARALGYAACNYFGNPSRRLKLVGVTGTNGKTTIVTLLYHLFRGLGHKVGLISTIENRIGDNVTGSTHTTPDPLQLNRLLREMAEEGCTFCFMEVSSHAIDQHRIDGLNFAGGIFTNITHDHLDYHKTFAEYIAAKRKFFDQLNPEAFALTNTDDRNGNIMVQNTSCRIYSYGLKSAGDFMCRIIDSSIDGLHLRINGQEMWLKLIGEFNAYNALAVFATASLLEVEQPDILRILSSIGPVCGRFDHFRSDNGIIGIVDYAHSPDALENVLRTIRTIRRGKEKIITVAGAGGDRDSLKRPVMGKIAAGMSDIVILTTDNPRSEDPEKIISDMRSGIPDEWLRKVTTVVDRQEAIHTACLMAQPGDIILVAGKGHEQYQEIKGVRYPFDDKEILKSNFLTGELKA